VILCCTRENVEARGRKPDAIAERREVMRVMVGYPVMHGVAPGEMATRVATNAADAGSKPRLGYACVFVLLVGREGLEPSTNGSKGRGDSKPEAFAVGIRATCAQE
jgi:hypothetical protein